MGLSNTEIKELVGEGHIRCLVTFEVVGKPSEYVEKTLDEFVEKLRKEKHIHILKENSASAEELDGDDKGFFSAFNEVEMLVPNMESLTYISFNLSPASIEIIEPDTFHFEARQMQNWLNDLLSQIHTISHMLRGEKQKSSHINQSLLSLLQNTITLVLMSGEKDVKTLIRMTGVNEDALNKVLKIMHEQKIIVEEKKKWKLNSPNK